MKRQSIAVRAVLAGAMIAVGTLVGMSGGASAQTPTMDKYYAVPPFVQDQVKPNVLILMDNSGSMECRAYDGTDCTGAAVAFTAATKYTGYFDEKTCYTYNSTDNRFEEAATKAAYGDTCSGGDKYDGNLLNYITFRRFDAVKKAMIGGDCYKLSGAVRDANGLCNPYGTPSKKTIKSQTKFSGSGTHHITPGLPRTNSSCSTTSNTSYCGRLPSTVALGGNGSYPNNIYFHLRGGTDGAQGSFCVAHSSSALSNSSTNCNVASGFSETQLWIRVALDIEPQGVIQRVGNQARFGLAVFNNDSSNNGIKVLTGVGLSQSVDLAGTVIENFNTNTAAMVDSIEESSPLTWTPLSESLYEAARYYAQINSSFFTSSYAYPIAFSGAGSSGVSLATNGVGSIGNNPSPGELKVLIGSETCPTGYIANACGRDPYFMGADQNFAWTKASIAAACCRSFVILLTDGTPTQDQTIAPTALKTYAQDNALPALDGTLCTGNRGVPFVDPPGSTCNNDPNTPNKVLLKQHRTDYGSSGSHHLDDIALWMHVNDLRPCGGGTAEVGDAAIAVLGTTGHCLKGLQDVTLYTMYAFGNISGRELLMHASMMGGFDDTNNNKKPDLQSEWDKVNNLTGTTGSTVSGCNADCIPDTYFESSNVDDLENRLLGALSSILSRSASGTSISVLATSSTGEGSIYQAYFYTNEAGQNGSPVKWKGYTQSLFIDQYGNFREDRGTGGTIPGDGRLVYEDDPIVTSEYYNNVDDVNDPNNRKVVVKRYADVSPADGQADTPTTTIDAGVLQLKDIQPVWEAGRALAELNAGTTTCTNANAGVSCRRILTWVDKDNDGFVDSDERQEFITGSTDINNYVTKSGSSAFSATEIINFIRGCEPTVCTEQQSLRYRQSQTFSGSGVFKTWKYGDPINSTPTVVAAPRERYDVIYGDAGYRAYYQMWRSRREMVYVGANDGMLHAFNGGYYHKGDDSGTPNVEHGWFTTNPTDNSGKKLGAEMWAFVPFQLLPQLEWLVREDYSHVYYVDLKPKVTDVAIFCEGGGIGVPAGPAAGKCIDGQTGVTHPGGYGTILIGGFRMGGSCGNCPSGSAPEMSFNVGGTNRKFYSAYFVLDVTDPEQDPKLLWSFTDANLGLTTSYPAVVRVNPTGNPNTSNADAQWLTLFGSGPNGYDASMPSTPVQTSRMYAVQMDKGPRNNGDTTNNPSYVSTFDVYDQVTPSVIKYNSFMGHIITLDRNLDFRVDVAYAGRTINDGTAVWAGKLERLKTGGCTTSPCSTATWGINLTGSTRSPSEVTRTFAGTTKVGPITAAPTVTSDDANNIWVFYGTGRYLSNSDKVDTGTQYLFGVKDKAMNTSCDETVSLGNCVSDQLVNVTNSVLCLICASGTNQVTDPTNTAVTTFNDNGTGTSMVGLVASKDGWYIAMPAGERSVASPTLIGGTVFFPSFLPTNDVCASTGTSYLYALFYKTGTAYTSPIIGTAAPASGTTNILNKITLGDGLASQMSMQIGRAGSGNVGTGVSSTGTNDANNTAGSTTGCAGGVTGAIQMGGGNVAKPCVRPSASAWSQYISWIQERG